MVTLTGSDVRQYFGVDSVEGLIQQYEMIGDRYAGVHATITIVIHNPPLSPPPPPTPPSRKDPYLSRENERMLEI